MRNRVAPKVVAPKGPSTSEKIDSLSKQLTAALAKIASLERALLKAMTPDDRPWTFDVERDSNGRIKEVTAHKDGSTHLVM